MRDALSALFNVNTIKVPINGHPRKFSEVPNGMRYTSISNC